MKTFLMAASVTVIGSAACAAPADLSLTYSSFVAFGDSLTDDGKFAGTPFEPGLPSDDGRFSNGPTFAEYIADDFAFAANFALGGATARNENESPLPPQFGTFGGQVATFGAAITDPFTQALVGDRPLFSVLFGANDILQNIGLPDDFDFVPGIGALAANAVEANIRAIGALGANFTDFVVMNLPDLSQTPLFTNVNFGASGAAPFAGAEAAGFNVQLSTNVDALRNDGFNIMTLDLDTLFEQNLASASLLGIDTANPCSFDLSNPGPENTCVFSPGSPDNVDLTLADNFFFIDGIHPNAAVHAALAEEFRLAVTVAPVPLPAGLPLLAVAMGAFGYMRTRKAA